MITFPISSSILHQYLDYIGKFSLGTYVLVWILRIVHTCTDVGSSASFTLPLSECGRSTLLIGWYYFECEMLGIFYPVSTPNAPSGNEVDTQAIARKYSFWKRMRNKGKQSPRPRHLPLKELFFIMYLTSFCAHASSPVYHLWTSLIRILNSFLLYHSISSVAKISSWHLRLLDRNSTGPCTVTSLHSQEQSQAWSYSRS